MTDTPRRKPGPKPQEEDLRIEATPEELVQSMFGGAEKRHPSNQLKGEE